MYKALRLAFLLPLLFAALACDSVNQAAPSTLVITLPASFTLAASPTPSVTSTSPTPQATSTDKILSQTPTASQTLTPTHAVTATLPSPTVTSTVTLTPTPSTATHTLVPTQPPPTFTTTSVPATAASVSAACQTLGNESLEDQLIALINAERTARGLGSLTEQGQLTAAARGHSADLACNHIFGHTGSTGTGLGQRLAAQGYAYSATAENIGAGYPTPQEMFDGWLQSDGHRENMLNPAYSQVGIGYVFYSGDEYGHYWTADFGSP